MKHRTELCEELQVVIQQAIAPYLDGDTAMLTSAILALIFKKFGGNTVYFPKQYSLKKQDRDAAILAAAQNGMPINRLSQHFNLSRTTIYHVLRTGRLNARPHLHNQPY